MNILRILDKLSNDKFFTGEASRLETITNITNFGKKAAVASIPLGLGGIDVHTSKSRNHSYSVQHLMPKVH